MAGYGVTITRGAASVQMFTYSTLLVTMCRNIITRLRETFLNRFIPFDSAVEMHKIVAMQALFFTSRLRSQCALNTKLIVILQVIREQLITLLNNAVETIRISTQKTQLNLHERDVRQSCNGLFLSALSQMPKNRYLLCLLHLHKKKSCEQPASCTDWLVVYSVTNMSQTCKI